MATTYTFPIGGTQVDTGSAVQPSYRLEVFADGVPDATPATDAGIKTSIARRPDVANNLVLKSVPGVRARIQSS